MAWPRATHVAGVYFIMWAIVFLSLMAVRSVDRLAFLREASRADGAIVAWLPRSGPQVAFVTASGQAVSFFERDDLPWLWWREERLPAPVHVLYLAANPAGTAVIDTFQTVWGREVRDVLIGVGFVVLGVLGVTGRIERWRR